MTHDPPQRRRPVRAVRRISPVKVSLAVLISAAAMVVLFAAGIVAERYSRGLPASGTTAVAGPPVAVVPAGPATGEAVRDGKFEFAVTRVDCSRTTVVLDRLKTTADGKFCVVSLTVRNVGDGAKYFVGQAQKAYDAAGAEYGSDELAGLYANRGVEAFVRRIGPGETATGKLVFDVPKKADLITLELHDSPLSGGVRAPLG
ncbi:DUF4352 domain-containing protein [Actinoplanes xinjiangensis]|uniref:DUF4352 domain-containing protein n=1 Tax=Actinoplanes xinjiangensis TaxID=512350 RepID=UPI00341D4C96